jgi:hypothetical protein
VVKNIRMVNERLTAQFRAECFQIFCGPAPNMDPSFTWFGRGCTTPDQAAGNPGDFAGAPFW